MQQERQVASCVCCAAVPLNCSQGTVLLRQGKEVLDIHFLIRGTVQITYTPPPPAAAVAAARQSLCSVPGAAELVESSTAGGAAGAAAAERLSIMLAGDLLRLDNSVVQPPVVLGVR